MLAVAAHSYADAYSTLTRGQRTPFHIPPDAAWAALDSVRAITVMAGLTAAQTFDAIRRYAGGKAVGPKLYDALIGEVAAVHAIPLIITWNASHMRGLFQDLAVTTPREFPARPR